jgi:hypothetical protein
MACSVLLALTFSTLGVLDGFRQQAQHATLSETSRSEAEVNEAADTNTKAFADARSTLGVCPGKGSPPSCCCTRASKVVQCKGEDSYFYPGVRPFDKEAAATRTCTTSGLCCKSCQRRGVDDDYDSSLCSATAGALLQQTIAEGAPEQSLDDFLAELDKAAPTGTTLSADTPAFLNVLAHKPNQQASANFMTRDYTLIIDRSGSMGVEERVHVPMKTAEIMNKRSGDYRLSRWSQVDAALQYLVPYIVAEDPDGIGVYFFDSKWDEAPNVCSESQVSSLFRKNRPGGRTYLGPVLKEAMEPDTVGRAETIFILTDGEASDPSVVTRNIIEYTKKMCKPEMLSISFIQVGLNGPAQDYLNSLDDDLEGQGARFDIVDAMTKDEMEGKSFLDVVELSVHD